MAKEPGGHGSRGGREPVSARELETRVFESRFCLTRYRHSSQGNQLTTTPRRDWHFPCLK